MKTRLKVLLVEDDPSHARLVRLTLLKADFTEFDLRHVPTLAEATQALADDEFDAILFDLGLSDSQGIDVLSPLLERGKDIPIVVLTASDDLRTAVAAVAGGAQDYLYKGDMTGRTLERVVCYAVQRQRMVRQMRDANRRLDRQNNTLTRLCDTAQHFVDHVSHEFRTPLTVIKEFTTIMCDGLAGEITDQQREFLGIINDRADDLAVMVDDMLDVSKLEAGFLNVWRRRAKIGDIIDHVRPVLQRKAIGKGVLFSIQLEDDLPEVYCDPEKAGRVIVNLVINAVKFCGAGDEVALWARRGRGDAGVVLGVTDNGPGIAKEDLETIFHRFHQIAGREEIGGRGFGLGLSIAKELVGLNLGDIVVESAMGKGSTFSFQLPLSEPRHLAACYVHRLTQSPDEIGWVAVATAEVPASTESGCLPLLDELLQHSFRGDDLVVPIRPRKWLVVLRCPPQDVNTAIARVRSTWEEVSRNRPGRPLPAVAFRVRGSWEVASQADEIFRKCVEEFDVAEEHPAARGQICHDRAEAYSHCR
jgi:signal transduction histidine kinase